MRCFAVGALLRFASRTGKAFEYVSLRYILDARILGETVLQKVLPVERN